MFPSTACVHILLLTGIALSVSGFQKVNVTLDRGTSINISSNQVKGCRVCTGVRHSHCSTSLLLKDGAPVPVEFECSAPQDVFSLEILRNIECDTKTCTSSRIVQEDSTALSPFLDFNRTYTWNLKAPLPKAFRIDFASSGFRQISASEICPDRHSYTLRALQTAEEVSLGKYCTKGPISSAQILTRGSFSVHVPAGHKLQNGHFDVSIGEEIKSLAKISLTLPEWDSSSELFSPNYPDSFPDDDVMEWYFEVSDGRRVSLQPLRLTEPRCLKKEAAVEYHGRGRVAQVVRLSEPQPEQSQGSFSLTLRNCEMDRARAGSPGLSLHLRVTSRSSQASCQVDVSKLSGLSLHLEQLSPAQSDCVMAVNTASQRNVTITSNSQLSFHRCLPGDIRVTASRVVECAQLSDCPKAGTRLSLPSLPGCLPSPLSSVTWTLRPPPHGTVELSCPMGSLKQELPQQPCNASMAFQIAEGDGTAVGRFCSQGSIQKILIHTNVTVAVSGSGVEALRRTSKPVLDVRMRGEISERYIFRVSPKRDDPVLVATPNWPVGMKDYSTVSWIVTVPERTEARLEFINTSQPKCSARHTNIRVQRVGRLEEDYSRREDEEAEGEIRVSDGFYLNMSNCMTESGRFSVLTRITLQKSTNFLLTTILSVVAALLVVFIIVLVVVCVVIRRKKKKMLSHQVSVYNPNGTSFLPAPGGALPRKGGDSEEHEYACIDDTLVYTHLLRNGQEAGVYGQVAEYRPFAGHSDSQRPLVSREGGEDGEAGPDGKRPSAQQVPPLPVRPLSHGLVDNAIYQAEEHSEEERSPALGPRMEPEGGN